MTVSLRESLQVVSDPANLDGSVEEVFRMMLGVECQRDARPVHHETESVTAVVGLAGCRAFIGITAEAAAPFDVAAEPEASQRGKVVRRRRGSRNENWTAGSAAGTDSGVGRMHAIGTADRGGTGDGIYPEGITGARVGGIDGRID